MSNIFPLAWFKCLPKRFHCRRALGSPSSSPTSFLKITTDDLFGDDKTAIEDNIPIGGKTVAAPIQIVASHLRLTCVIRI